MAILLPSGKFSSETITGAPLVGGKVYAYVPNTSTPKDTYTTTLENVQNPHPVILDSRGEATIYWSGSYDVILKDSAGVTIWGPERLQETGSADDLEARLASTASVSDGDALVGVKYGATSAVALNLHEYIEDDGSYNLMGFVSPTLKAAIRDYSTTTDVTAALQLAHDALPAGGGSVFIPRGRFVFNQTTQAAQFAISKSNFELKGAGPGTQLVKLNSGVVTGNQAIIMLRPLLGTLSCVTIRDIQIIGPTTNNGTAPPGTSNVLGILVHDGTAGASANNDITDVLIDSVIIRGMETAAFALTNGTGTGRNRRIRYSNCLAKNGRQDGFNDFGGGSFDVTYSNCYATDLDGFGHEHGSQCNILGGVVARTGQAGIGIEFNGTLSPDAHVLIQGVRIHDIYTTASPDASGISLGQAVNPQNATVQGCVITRVGGHGIVVNLTPDNIILRGNTIHDVGKGAVNKRGIQVPGGTNISIYGNAIRTYTAGYTMDYGIVNASSSNTNTIFNNDIGASNVQKIFSNGARITRGLTPQSLSTPTGNINAGEDDLLTYTIPANTLEADGQSIRVRSCGYTAANANNKQAKFYFAGTQLWPSGVAAANDKDWWIEATILRTSSTTAIAHVRGEFNGALVASNRTALTGLTFTSTMIVKTTGEATATNDIVNDLLTIEYIDEKSS